MSIYYCLIQLQRISSSLVQTRWMASLLNGSVHSQSLTKVELCANHSYVGIQGQEHAVQLRSCATQLHISLLPSSAFQARPGLGLFQPGSSAAGHKCSCTKQASAAHPGGGMKANGQEKKHDSHSQPTSHPTQTQHKTFEQSSRHVLCQTSASMV